MTGSDGEPYIEYYDPESDPESDAEWYWHHQTPSIINPSPKKPKKKNNPFFLFRCWILNTFFDLVH
jgi:hypothetical protein